MRTKTAEKSAAHSGGQTEKRTQTLPIAAWTENSFAVPFIPASQSARVLFYVTAASTPEPGALYPLVDWLRAQGVSFAMTAPLVEDLKDPAR